MSTDPQNLPSYKHPDYVSLQLLLTLLSDCYNGLQGRKIKNGHVIGSVKEDYLPKAQKEPEKAYRARVAKSVFDNKIRPIIDSNAGLLTVFDVSGLPPSLADTEDNVDLMGSSFKSFVLSANIMALRDRCCYILTMEDAPQSTEGSERTLADDIESPRRPYWKLIDRRNIINWRLKYIGGRPVLTQVTIVQEEDTEDGLFGLAREVRYHVLKLVGEKVQHTVYKITDKDELTAVGKSRTFNIPRIPLRPYFDCADFFPVDIPEFAKAAELNVKLFRQESTLDNIQYRVNAPTFWRRSRTDVKERPSFIAGENYVIELYSADDVHGPDEVGVLEIDGSGVDALMRSVTETKEAIEAESLGFLYGSSIQRTATETYLSGAQVSASLNGKARQRDAALRGMTEDWCMFTGEDPDSFQVETDHSLLEMPLDAQEMAQLLNLKNNEIIDHRTLLELLRMGRQLPPSANIDEILERIAEERRSQQATPNVPNGLISPLELVNTGEDADAT